MGFLNACLASAAREAEACPAGRRTWRKRSLPWCDILESAALGIHVEELTEVVRALKQLPPSSGTVALLKRIIDETDQLQRAAAQ